MSVAVVPRTVPITKRRSRLWVIAGVLVVIAAVAAYALVGRKSTAGPVVAAQVYQVVPIDMEIKVSKDGELAAINNIDVLCAVEGTVSIQSVVKEGTTVKKGDLLMTLDSTQIRERLEDTTIELEKAQADVTNARDMFDIQKTTNDTNLESAEVTLALAKLDLKQYVEGIYPQQLASAQTEVKMAEITLNNRLDDLEQTQKLYTRNFVTAADLKKAELDVTTARNSLDKATTALRVLTDYTHEMDLTQKRNSVLNSEQRLNRTKRENNNQISWRTADLTAKERNLSVLERRHRRLEEQITACNVVAPADGMVIYGSTTDRNAQTPIQEGTQVREKQLLVRLPDTSQMKAVVRIHETMVSKLQVGQPAVVRIVGQPAPVPAKVSKISVMADNSQRWWNPDLREYPIDVALDQTIPDLKPGIGATVEILLEKASNVLAIPLDSVYTVGGERYAFVPDGESAKPVKVQVGTNNEAFVEITDGLTSGQNVLRLQAGQGRELLEKAGIKVGPSTQPKKSRGSATS